MKSNLLFVLLAITTSQFMNAEEIRVTCLTSEKDDNGTFKINYQKTRETSIDAHPNESVLEVSKRACEENSNLEFTSATTQTKQGPVTIPGDTEMGRVLNFTEGKSLLKYLHETNYVLFARYKRK